MHVDFHYFGTYAMARAAGLRPEICQIIATSAQFVDDNDGNGTTVDFEDGGRFVTSPTAHPMVHIDNTVLGDDQRRVWLPFHFLPGGEGDGISERLVCRKDSAIAQQMVNHCLSLIRKPFGLHLVGIAAHVYADTFSHYGFSGVSSRWNKVDGESLTLLNDERDPVSEDRFLGKYGFTTYLDNWRQSLVDSVKSGVAEIGTGALGHGGALKYPDYPYLEWEFSYEHDGWDQPESSRDNSGTYLEACEKLHAVFIRIGQDNPDFTSGPYREFADIREAVTRILKTRETDKEKRSLLWMKAAEEGDLFASGEAMRPYPGLGWKSELDTLQNRTDSRDAFEMPAFRFLQAAATYRVYVLRSLLPEHGLIVD